MQTRFCGSCGHADTFSVCFPSPKDHRESPLIDPESPMEGSPGWGSLHRNSLKFLVGGNLLSHTLPGAVPSARTGLASGFGKGPGVSLPLSTTDTHTGHTKYPVTRVSCQTLHSGREPHHHWCDQIICFVTNASNTSPTQQGVCYVGKLVPVTSTHYCASRSGLSTPSSPGNLKRNLISKQASRLDAFSGYPFRT